MWHPDTDERMVFELDKNQRPWKLFVKDRQRLNLACTELYLAPKTEVKYARNHEHYEIKGHRRVVVVEQPLRLPHGVVVFVFEPPVGLSEPMWLGVLDTSTKKGDFYQRDLS